MKTKEIVLSIVMLFVGAFATYLLDVAKSKSDNKKRFIEYGIHKDNSVFSKPNITNKKISILLDGNPIEQLSKLTIPLFNRVNNTDLKDLKIYFELYNLNGDSIKLVNTTATREDNNTEGIHTIDTLTPPSKKGGMKKGYTLSSLNRKEDFSASFIANFYFEGNTIPECNVFIDQPDLKDQPGVEARLLDYNNFTAWYDSYWGAGVVIIAALLGYFLIIFLIVRIINFLYSKRFEKRKMEREQFILSQMKANTSISILTSIEDITRETIFLGEFYNWKQASRMSRFISKIKEPIRKEKPYVI